MAVLVFTNSEAGVIRDALEAAGLPAVLNGTGNVFDTETARQWLRLLEALERPASAGRARAVALTPFFGWTPQRLAAGHDDELEALQAELHGCAAILSGDGVAALLEHLSAGGDLPARMLSESDGERRLTDIRHIAQLLHAEAVGASLGIPALTGWLGRRIGEAANGTGASGSGAGGATAEERSRRLESDSEAVQVLTIHRSKGLEWPVVYLPFLWGNGPDDPDPVPVYHDPQSHQRRVDVRGRSSPHLKRYTEERRGEDLRLAYVALTRARNAVVVWWAGSKDSRSSPLGRLLAGAHSSAGTIAAAPRDLSDAAVVAQLEGLAARAPSALAVEHLRTPAATGPGPEQVSQTPLAVRPFARSIDRSWRRTSYSAITDAPHRPAPTIKKTTDPTGAGPPRAPPARESGGREPGGPEWWGANPNRRSWPMSRQRRRCYRTRAGRRPRSWGRTGRSANRCR